jgi:LacI family transcriptional regulator
MSDVAKLAGVSTMTVSRVLNENPNVSEDTRKRVNAAITKLKYRRNELARSLREQRTRQIGILVPNLYDPFFALCTHVVSSAAREHGYSVVIAASNEEPATEFDEASRMLQRNVEGLIVIPASAGKTPSGLLDAQFGKLPIVTLDRPIEGSSFDSIVVQNKKGAQIATEHLLSLHHRRIVCFELHSGLYTIRQRRLGYEKAMQDAGLKPRVFTLSENQADTLEQLKAVLSSKPVPTAIFCSNNLATRSILRALHALGMHPPAPLALAGFDDFETADLMRPGITVIRQPLESIGRLAAEILFSRVVGAADPQIQRLMLPVELVIRGSCGAKPS